MSRKRTRLAISVMLATLLLFVIKSVGQQSTSPADSAARIEVNVNRVLVPVIVRDKQGKIVEGLQKEDFQVFEDDKAVAIANFSVEKNQESQIQMKAGAGQQSSAAPINTDTLPQRIVVFLFDDMHLSTEDLAYAKKAGLKAIDGSLSVTDVAAVVSTSGKTNSGLTRDRVKLEQAITGLQTHSLYRADASECPKVDYYQADLMENKHDSAATEDAIRQVFSCNPGLDVKRDIDIAERQAHIAAGRVLMVGNQDTSSTYATTKELIRRLSGLPGQHLLIFISPGFLTLAPEALLAESQMIDFAAQSNVVVSALDARGLYSALLDATEKGPSMTDINRSGGSVQLQGDYRRSSMSAAETTIAALAEGTGGTFFHNNNDLDAGLAILTAMPSSMYVLELPVNDLKPGSHRLAVKVDREGSQVQSRKNYFVARREKPKK